MIHLVRRFAEWVLPARLSGADEAWALDRLSPPERNLWLRQQRRDRAHSIAVARAVVAEVGEDDPRVTVAALCHDVGKGVAGLGVVGRVAATVADRVVDETTAARWAWRSDPLGRIGMYLRYPALGAELLSEGGSDPLVVAWAREHHLEAEDWTVPRDLGEVLRRADDQATAWSPRRRQATR